MTWGGSEDKNWGNDRVLQGLFDTNCLQEAEQKEGNSWVLSFHRCSDCDTRTETITSSKEKRFNTKVRTTFEKYSNAAMLTIFTVFSVSDIDFTKKGKNFIIMKGFQQSVCEKEYFYRM